MRFDSQYKCGVVTKNIILSYNNPVKERLFKYKIKSLIYLLVRKGKRNEPSGYLRATKPNQIKSVLKKNFILCIYMYYYLLSFDFSVPYACIYPLWYPMEEKDTLMYKYNYFSLHNNMN